MFGMHLIWLVIGSLLLLPYPLHSVSQGFASSTLHLTGNMPYQRLPTIVKCVSARVMP